MRKFVPVILLSACIVVGVSAMVGAQAGLGDPGIHNYNTIEVDNFDMEGFWTAKYSRYRSINWDSRWGETPQFAPVTAPRPEEPPTPSSQWISWIGDSPERQVIPTGLRDMKPDQGTDSARVLGIRANYDFPGYNWFTVEPTFTRSAGLYPDSPLVGEGRTVCSHDDGTIDQNCSGQDYLAERSTPPYSFLLHENHYIPSNHRTKLLPHYIQIPGKSEAIDFWVWGKGYRYNMEMHLEDFHGNAHVVNGPSLNWLGWRNVRLSVPAYIQQSQHYLPQTQGVKFLRFKVTAEPGERPDDFYTYIDYMQALTDLYVEPFFGDDLVRHPRWDNTREER